MFDNIESKTETTVVHSLVLTLSEAEVNEALIAPSKLLKRLRQARRKWFIRGGATWSATGHASSRPRRGRKAADTQRTLAKKSAGAVHKQRCPKCHQDFKRLAKHQPHCQGIRDPLALPLSKASADLE